MYSPPVARVILFKMQIRLHHSPAQAFQWFPITLRIKFKLSGTSDPYLFCSFLNFALFFLFPKSQAADTSGPLPGLLKEAPSKRSSLPTPCIVPHYPTPALFFFPTSPLSDIIFSIHLFVYSHLLYQNVNFHEVRVRLLHRLVLRAWNMDILLNE